MSPTILILKTGTTKGRIFPDIGDFEDWFIERFREIPGRADLDILMHDVVSGSLPSIRPRALVVTGSFSSVYDPLPWIAPVEDYLRSSMNPKTFVLGVCFGHQLLAHALGGRVEKNPRGREFGTYPVTLTAEGMRDPLFCDCSRIFLAQESHTDVVTVLPEGARVLASSPLDPFHALRIGKRAWTVQFHPEMLAIHARAVLASCGEESGRAAQASKGGVEVAVSSRGGAVTFKEGAVVAGGHLATREGGGEAATGSAHLHDRVVDSDVGSRVLARFLTLAFESQVSASGS